MAGLTKRQSDAVGVLIRSKLKEAHGVELEDLEKAKDKARKAKEKTKGEIRAAEVKRHAPKVKQIAKAIDAPFRPTNSDDYGNRERCRVSMERGDISYDMIGRNGSAHVTYELTQASKDKRSKAADVVRDAENKINEHHHRMRRINEVAAVICAEAELGEASEIMGKLDELVKRAMEMLKGKK